MGETTGAATPSIPDRLTYEQLAVIVRACTGVQLDAAELDDPGLELKALGVDSLGLLGVVAELERRYPVLLGREAEQAASARALYDLVNAQLARGDRP
ncbi:acyl carrier protein [Streptomyces sp. NPDC001262]|uniref:acyl carrier protein n=1 Tax=Streptomyces TaxID=1883 RepID=UPI0036AF1311